MNVGAGDADGTTVRASMDTFELEMPDHTRLVVHRLLPEGRVRGLVTIVHGVAEHAGRYSHVAEALAAAGHAVYAPDLRGHGRTVVAARDVLHLADRRGWATALDDVHRVVLHARGAQPSVPSVLLGHSLGSFLAQQYLFTFGRELDGLVLSGSDRAVGPLPDLVALIARVERWRLGPRGRSPLLARLVYGTYNLPFRPARTPFDWLSRDPAEVDRYLADPACGGNPTTQLTLDAASGIRVIRQVERVRAGAPRDVPLYVFSGSDDPVGGARGVERLVAHYREAGLREIEHRVYPGGRHEMFNEYGKDEVIADLLSWLERRIPIH